MPGNRMDSEMKKFLDDEFLNSTLMATLGRSGTYEKETTDADKDKKDKKKFRNFLKEKLRKISKEYTSNVDPQAHIDNIQILADECTKYSSPILKDKKFRIGGAQKALNLYLKYLWCIGEIPTPPHCPFNNKIIDELGCKDIRWTKLDDIEKYQRLVKAAAKAKQAAGIRTIARWELEKYNEDRG